MLFFTWQMRPLGTVLPNNYHWSSLCEACARCPKLATTVRLMLETTATGEVHDHVMLISSQNTLLVAYRTPWLDYRTDAGTRSQVD
jgi:hypothetical protein